MSHSRQGLVVVDFGKQVESVAMKPQQAIELVQMLIKHAREITTETLAVCIH